MEDEITALIEREYHQRIYGMRCEVCQGQGTIRTAAHDPATALSPLPMPLSYVAAFEIAEKVRRSLPHWKLREGVERAAALAAIEADDPAAAIGDTFKEYRIREIGVLDG